MSANGQTQVTDLCSVCRRRGGQTRVRTGFLPWTARPLPFFPAGVATFAFLMSLSVWGGDPVLTAEPVYTCQGRPVACSILVENSSKDWINIRKVETNSDNLHVLLCPTTVSPGDFALIECLLFPSQAGEVSESVHVELDRPQGKRLTCLVEGFVDEAPISTVPDYTGLRNMLKVLGTRWIRTPEWGLYCSPSEIGGSSLVLVDIRPESEFLDAHIPGAVQVPPFAVTSRTFLKGREIVLVDDGLCRPETEDLCRRLVQKGVASARILEGGLMRWRKELRPVEGLGRARATTVKMGSLNQILSSEDWQVVYVGTNISAATVFLPGSLVVPLNAKKSSGTTEGQELSDLQADISVLLVGDADLPESALGQLGRESGRSMFVLEGGLDAHIRTMLLLAGLGQSKQGSMTHVPHMNAMPDGNRAGMVRKKGGCGCSGS